MATEKFFVFNEDGALKRLKGRIVRYLDNEDPTGSDKSAIRTSLEVSPDAAGLVQADVGTAPNEIPVNGMLGDMAYQSSDGVSVGTLEVTDKVDGSLGIGVTPDKPLHVGGSGEQTLRLENTSDGLGDGSVVGSIEFEANDSSTNGSGVVSKIQSESLNATGNLFGLSFHTGHGGSMTEKMLLDNDGRLGIGTSSPIGPLTVRVATDKNLVTSTQYSGASLEAVNDAYSANIPLAIYGSPIRLLSGNVEVNSGNIVMGSSYGIDFGSTSSGSGNTVTSGLLDDYEEGDWTPSPTSGSITGTGLTYVGKYTKIGRMVQIYIRVNATAQDINVSSYVGFTGVPFSISTKASGTVIGEDIDQVAQQGFAALSSNTLFFGACGNSTAIGLTATLTGYI